MIVRDAERGVSGILRKFKSSRDQKFKRSKVQMVKWSRGQEVKRSNGQLTFPKLGLHFLGVCLLIWFTSILKN